MTDRRGRTALFAVLVLLASVTRAAAGGVALPQFLAVDVPAVTVEGGLLMNGAPIPPDASEVALFHLFAPGDDALITIGTNTAQVHGPRVVVSGDYTPVYEWLFSNGLIPVHPAAALSPVLPLTTDTVVDIDVPAIDVTFDFTIDGAPPPADPGESGRIWLRDASSGVSFPVGFTDAGSATIRIIPGLYDVVYSHFAGTTLPQNQQAVLIAGLSLRAPQTVAVDIPTWVQTLTFTLNGAPMPISPLEQGEIFLRDLETGDFVSFGPSSAGSATRTVLPRTYAATWSVLLSGVLAPANTNAVIAEGLLLGGVHGAIPTNATIDVEAYTVSASPTLNGAPFPLSPLETGEIFLVGANGDSVSLGVTHQAPPSRVVIAGSYDVHYRRVLAGTVAPRNPDARVVEGVVVDADGPLPIDVPVIEVTPAFTVDGAGFSPSPLETGDFTLVGEIPGDVISLGASHEAPPTVPIVAGSYDVVYDWQAGSVVVPRNQNYTVMQDVDLLSTQVLAVDLQTEVVAPTFTLNGAPFPLDPMESGTFALRSMSSGSAGQGEVDLGPSYVASPDFVRVIEGSYRVEYTWQDGFSVPANEGRVVAITYVPEPGFVVGLAVGILALRGLGRLRRNPV
jgi:hypothetical protein